MNRVAQVGSQSGGVNHPHPPHQHPQQGQGWREKVLLQARLAQQTQRFEEMVRFVRLLGSEEGIQLRREEEQLLSAAYKNLVGSKRAELRVLMQIEKTDRGKQSAAQNRFLTKYIQKIEQEICEKCEEVIEIIDGNLMRNVVDLKQKVFFFKLKGDYLRYYAECLKNRLALEYMRLPDGIEEADAADSIDDRAVVNHHRRFEFRDFDEINDEAMIAYREADKLAKSELALSNPLRLALYLNMSVYFFEIQEKIKPAIQIANDAFQGAINNIESENEENYRDCTLIMQLLRDNITLWNDLLMQQEYDPQQSNFQQ